jgi:hypothetical protein
MTTLAPFKESAAGIVELREGGGFLSVFGVPFFAAGVFVTLLGLGIVPVQNAASLPWWAWPVFLLMGLCFLAVGGTLVFGRRWTTFDVDRGLIARRWGALVPMKSRELSLGDYSGIRLEFKAGDADSVDRYPVLLQARSGGADLNLYSSVNFGDSRQRAVFLAKYLRLPLTDATTPQSSTLEPERVEETFQQKLQGGSAVEDVSPPPFTRSLVQERTGLTQIVIPGPRFRLITLVPHAIPACVMAYLLPGILRFFSQTRTPQPVQLAFMGFVAFVFIGLPGLSLVRSMLQASRRRTTITASREGIVIEEDGTARTRATRIPAGEILDLSCSTAEDLIAAARSAASQRAQRTGDAPWRFEANASSAPWWFESLTRLVRSKGIIVKSKTGLYSLGPGLPDDELRYLHAVIARALEKR